MRCTLKVLSPRFIAIFLGLLAIRATATTYYVDINSTDPTPPYTNWATASTDIQSAVDQTTNGDLVMVNDGVYGTGGETVNGFALTNRVVVDKAITVQSVNGPAVTIILGYQDTNSIFADDAVRCVYLTNNAVLSGFTLTNGATRAGGDVNAEQSGGGIWSESTNVLVTNCIIVANAANNLGGGAFSATLVNCVLTNNFAEAGGGAESCTLCNCTLGGNGSALYGGGADNSVLNQCTLINNQVGVSGVAASVQSGTSVPNVIVFPNYGGGAENSSLTNCTLTGNQAVGYFSYGGGADSSTLVNCLLSANVADNYGGGANGSTLIDCNLTDNNAGTYGGGAEAGTLFNCTLTGNSATNEGGGTDGSTLNNCILSGNSAADGGGVNNTTLNNCALSGNSSAYAGGGAESSTLNNCNLVGNSAAALGGGADNCTLNNCIAFYNTAPDQANDSSSTLNYCCTTPLPGSGANNITADPLLTDAAHISAGSPCIGAGSPDYSSGVDIDGQPWLNPPSIGCDEYYAGAATGSLSPMIQGGYTDMVAGLTVNFTGIIIGHATMDVWDFGDGTTVTNELSVSHVWPSAGTYTVVLTAYNDSNPDGVSVTLVVSVEAQSVAYVSANNPNPAAPYLTWDTAATNIQDAVDAVLPGGTVWVTNGIYDSGGCVLFSSLTNRVALAKPITVSSVNGPSVTTIEGVPTLGDDAVRCAYLTNGATLAGFTLANGATLVTDDNSIYEQCGGGAYCESAAAVLSNCVVSASSAATSGGGVYQGTLENCVLTGNQATYYGNGDGGGADSAVLVGCVLSTNLSYVGGGAENSTLVNCTLSGNYDYIDSDYTANGGGVANSLLTNCVLSGNSSLTGAGACGSTLVNCALIGNSTEIGDGVWPPNGGGACLSTLINCTVAYNTANSSGGGVASCTLTNCIVYFNSAPNGTNYSDDSTLSYCDADPLAATNGVSNIDADPLLADSEHISSTSPCRGAGIFAATSGVDIDGDAWLNPPSIGCDEFNPLSATGALSVAISETFTNVSTSFNVNFAGLISGHATANSWDFGDGTVVNNELALSHNWSTPGIYNVTFTVFNTDNPDGIAASVTVFVSENPVHYVSLESANPEPPYLSWATAATNIQDAVNAAFAGGTIMVSNGVYQCGQYVIYGTMTNRVAVTKPLTLQSVNGAAATVIDGGNMVRCLYLTNGVTVTGFTLQNGSANGGAGVYCENNAILNDCLITNNSSPDSGSGGGGASGGTLNRCTLVGNFASYLGSGAANATLNFCILSNNGISAYGGGACYCTLNNCLIVSNSAAWGGGVDDCTLNNSLCFNNWAEWAAGGALWSTLNNCTVVGNLVLSQPGTYGGGGTFGDTLNNSIVYYNTYYTTSPDANDSGSAFNYCCTPLVQSGAGNITNTPCFVNWTNNDFHLQSNSPCINSGNNAYVSASIDFGGNPRIVGGTVDIGAYEYQTPTSVISYAYLQQYGLPADGSVDFTDLDGTGFNVYQDWIAGLNPTNSSSVLAMLPPIATNNTAGVTVTWQSVANILYDLQRSTNLSAQPVFCTIQSNIVGQAGTTSYTDTSATNNIPYFYRVGVP